MRLGVPRQGPQGAAEGRTRHGASAASAGAGPSSAEGDPGAARGEGNGWAERCGGPRGS
jgi:hypothetical protein